MTHNKKYIDRYIEIMRSVEPREEMKQRIIGSCLVKAPTPLPSKPAIAAVSCTVVILAVGSKILYGRRKRAQ